jgi:hypothetical protein
MFCTDILCCTPVIDKLACGERVCGPGVLNITPPLWIEVCSVQQSFEIHDHYNIDFFNNSYIVWMFVIPLSP